MSIFDNPEAFWLNVTNIALGVVTVVCIAAVGWVVLQEVVQRVRGRVPSLAVQDDHAFVIPALGLTMADGGERLDRPAPAAGAAQTPSGAAPAPEDEPHIIRSVN